MHACKCDGFYLKNDLFMNSTTWSLSTLNGYETDTSKVNLTKWRMFCKNLVQNVAISQKKVQKQLHLKFQNSNIFKLINKI